VTSPGDEVFDTGLLTEGRLDVAVSGGVATITLNAPQVRNAQLPATWSALAHIGSRICDGVCGDVRVVLVRGAGPSFSAGLDRSAFGGGPDSLLATVARQPPAVADETISGFQGGFGWLANPLFVSVAAVQGHAVGAGFQLALACDLIVAADDAQFAMAEVTLGLVPDLGGTGRLVRAVGTARALEICATGRRVGAAEAVRIGLAVTAVPVAELDAAVADLAAALTAPDGDAVRGVTRLITGCADRTVSQQLAQERYEQVARLQALAAARAEVAQGTERSGPDPGAAGS
jgi:enoyl-CoA hydratase/carnithine racemase